MLQNNMFSHRANAGFREVSESHWALPLTITDSFPEEVMFQLRSELNFELDTQVGWSNCKGSGLEKI